ncbi:MAG: hydroxyacid dehydrogenase [Patescibacteria group bacterium]|jgi:D-lactate dehydrogenase|nr:hydroxyacid dehydrogenase [Patescibacteria group bacterium]
MKIAFFEIKGWEKKYLNKQLKGHNVTYYEEVLNENNVSKVKNFDIVSVFIYSKVDKKVISGLPKLKLITTRSTGFDHIDLKEAKKRKIPVCNVPSYGENTVAEHTFALILSLSRNIHKSYLRSTQKDFSIDGLKGFDLKGKTLGIVGAGKIGMHVIRMARAFSMRVIVFDVNQDTFLADVLGFEYGTFDEVLQQSDIISLHAPYNKHTHHMINMDNIKIIKKGAILINTSRGGLVDIDALITALDKKILAGAGLDVIEGEELIKEEKQLLYDKAKIESLGYLIKDHILLNKDNVVFTPHIAFYSQEALERILETTAENIDSYLDEKIKNLV